MGGAAAGWYGRQLAIVYAPQILTQLFIRFHTSGKEISKIQKVYVYLVLAPAAVPKMMPYAQIVAGTALATFVITVGNALDRKIEEMKNNETSK